jgi:hypothetical protein
LAKSPFLIWIPRAGTSKDGYCRLTKGEKTMQGLKGAILVAMILTTGIVLGGCGHHEKAVVAEPLKLG